MACEDTDDITIEFPATGVEIQPLKTDIREQQRAFARGQFDLTEEAGTLVDENTPEAATALVKFNGRVAYRLYLPHDTLTFETDLENDTIAKMPLLDARQVLRRGSVEKSFGDTTPQDIVDFIMEEKNDPDDVIVDYEFVTEEISELERNLATADWAPGFIQDFEIGASRAVDGFLGIDHYHEETDYSGFDFDGVSPLEAMQEAMQEFEVNWWVEDDGVMYIGPHGTRNQMVASAAHENNITLSRYSVTRDAKTTNAVQIRGPVNREYVNPPFHYTQVRGTGLRTISEAHAENMQGSLLIREEDKRIFNPEELEGVALSALYQEVMDDISGSVDVNGLASTNMDAIVNLAVGDYFGADPSIEEECDEDVVTGLFMITSIHHLSDDRRGWKITLELSRIPDPDAITTRSVYYDPEEDREYESMEAYREAEEEEDDDDPGDSILIPPLIP